MRRLRWIPLLAAGWFCGGCASNETDAGTSPFGPTGVPPHLRPKGFDEGSAVTPGGNQSQAQAEALAKALDYDPSSDLAWTQADDADAGIPELEQIWKGATQGSRWLESESQALRESKKSGKPLLIWFNDKQIAASNTINTELLSTKDFEEWAHGNTVRLVVDMNPTGKDADEVFRRTVHNRQLKKKYNARGFPTLVVLSPSGEVIGRYSGYRRGKEDYLWGQLKQGVSVAADNYKNWRSGLEKKGYREWSDGKGRAVFARLVHYHEGELVLVEPDGQRARTHENKLSSQDRLWIQQQKAARGIR
jgi:thioredoxin-related protein